MTEKDVEREVCKYARTQYAAMTPKFTSPGTSGVPDRIFIFPDGRILFVEFKSPTGRLTHLQERMRLLFEGYRQTVFVINDISTGKQKIDAFANRSV